MEINKFEISQPGTEKENMAVFSPEIVLDPQLESNAEAQKFKNKIPELLKELPESVRGYVKKIEIKKPQVNEGHLGGEAHFESFSLYDYGARAEKYFFHEFAHVIHERVDMDAYQKTKDGELDAKQFTEEWKKVSEGEIDEALTQSKPSEELPFFDYLKEARIDLPTKWDFDKTKEDVAKFVERYYRPNDNDIFELKHLKVPLSLLCDPESEFYKNLSKAPGYINKTEIFVKIANKYKKKIALLKEFGFIN